VTAKPPLDEFERIARFFAPLAAPGGLRLLDDAALIPGPKGEQYVLKTDAIVAGVHFRPDDPPGEIAQKLLRVNLSDLAAKGAAPVGYLLVTCLPPDCGEAWIEAFAKGLAADQKRFGIKLYGGDSTATPGPATLSVAAFGKLKRGSAILRAGAKPGDLVYVSGTLGDAALGLAALKGALTGLAPIARDFLIRRYRLPEPRLDLGRALAGLAHAAADISDGLVADLGHICTASKLGAVIEARLVPLSKAAREAIRAEPERIFAALCFGDDYELVFAAPARAAKRIAALSKKLGLPLTQIGRFEKGAGVRVLDASGKPAALPQAGYRHF
jgi:thiamine-monophosphate kinase